MQISLWRKRYHLFVAVTLLSIAVTAVRAAGDPDLPGVTPQLEQIPAGSLVIPMCTNLQALAGTPFNMKAYGLVNALLHTNIPVKWAIAVGKSKDAVDFTGNASRILPTATNATNTSFRGGPFIIHRDYTNKAMAILTNWDNKVAVYRLNTDTTVDVRYTLCHKPRVAVLDDGNTQTIQTSILDEAGVPTNHYIVLHAADVSFLAASDCYTLVTSPHFVGGVTATNQTHSIREFVMNGGNFLAQCAAVDTYEDNVLYGFFQSTKGVDVQNKASAFVYRNADMAFNQFQGNLANQGGHTQEWDLSPGSSFTNHGYVGVLNAANTNNIRSAVAKLYPGKPGSVVFYLGGHSFAGNTLSDYNGRRMYLNALFVPPDRPAGCVIVFQTDLCVGITNSFNAVTNGQKINYTITVSNCGPGRVEGASVTDFFPPTLQNVTWTSITNGGATADSTAGVGNINNTVAIPILGTITYTVSAIVSPDAAAPIIDSVSVSLPVGMTDPTPLNNVASITNRLMAIAKPPPDVTVSCLTLLPPAATNISQFLAQGGIAATQLCGISTTVAWGGDVSNGGQGCLSSPLVVTRTYTLTTGCGDIQTVVQKFTVVNSAVPVITGFPADATFSCANLVPGADNNLVTATDICSTGVVTHDADVITAGSCPNRYTIARTYRVTDSCGNSTSRTQNITVNDQAAPTIVNFPADATYSCANAVPAANDTLVTATDACSGSVTVSHNVDFVTSSNCANRFTITRTYVATDACGNSSSRIQTIIVSGMSAPTIATFPPDATYSCADGIPAANDTLVTGTDGCGANFGVIISHTADVITSSNCVNRFTISRTYIATDACGNSSSKTQLITVNATNAPTITTFPSDVTFQCASMMPAADDKQVSATDSCGVSAPVTISHLPDVTSSSNCVSRFTIARTYVATDACGNSCSRTQTITVDSTTPPQITSFPADVSAPCYQNIQVPNNNLVIAVDNCGGKPTVTHDADLVIQSNCVNNLVIIRTYRVTDACGNSTSRSQTITINDHTPPALIAPIPPTNVIYSCAGSVPPPDDSILHAIDNCNQTYFVTHDPDTIVSSNCVNQFTLKRIYHVRDLCGNTIDFTQTLRINGTTAPAIVAFPADATYTCASAVPSADNSLVTATDGCGTGQVGVSHDADAISSATCDNRYVIRRTYTAVDACGNSASQTQTITINNTTPPTITQFPVDATYSCASDVPQANDSLVIATNACGDKFGVIITHGADVITSSNCVSRFTIARTYTATDNCGNATTRTQAITVNATTAPTVTTFPADATYSCASAVPAADNSLIAATDGCGGNSGIIIMHNADTVASSNCLNHFTITRTYIAIDACGNSSSKSQLITVNSTNAPIIAVFPNDATYQCSSQVPAADDKQVGATDSCGGSAPAAISHLPDVLSSSNCISRFTIARTYIATDACGNSASRTQTITVNGTTPPQIIAFPPNATYSCASLVPAANNSLVTAIDNCGALPNITHDADLITESNCPNRFTITRTYRVTDACGNSASRSQMIAVNDRTAPGLRLPLPSFEVNVSCASDVPAADDSSIHAEDNCGGGVIVSHQSDVLISSNCVNRFTLRRLYHVSDSCGNVTNFTQTIHVNSTTAPTITAFPVDATYTCASTVPAANDSLVTAIDGCGTGQVHISHSADAISDATCDNRYTIHRTYTAVDACSNSSSKTQIITINNTTAPTITEFPADATYSCSGDVPAANDHLVVATNACGDKFGMVITHAADVVTSSNCVNRFTITRTYTATDNCGNSSTKSQTITVNATTPPSIANFPADATYSCAAAVPVANDTLVTAKDGCGASLGITVTHNDDAITSSNCVNRFTLTRTYVVTDACGNSSSKSQTMTVNGTTPPTITTFPADLSFACAGDVPAANDGLVSAIDNCGGNAITISHDSDVVISNICVNNFVINRIYRVADACGNSASRTQSITVRDNIPPVISCPPDFTVSHVDDIPGPNTELVFASDNCSVPIKSFVGESSVTNNNIITFTRTFAATDDCGNSSTCAQTITMNPYLAAPIASPDAYSGFENRALDVAAPGVLANDSDSNNLPLHPILITGVGHGTLTLNDDGSFRYTPNSNYVGSDSFVYLANNGGSASSPVTVSLTVTPVNQPPSFNKGPNQVVNNYDLAQTKVGWAAGISPGPANESAQTVSFIVSNNNNSIFSVQPVISPNGTLTYAPAAGKYGVAIVSAALKDNGGTANGGQDTSATQTFSIIVNNPPIPQINLPTNTSLFLYPAPVFISATAFDLDGTVTNVTFLNGTNVIGQGVLSGSNTYTMTWTNAPSSNSVLYAVATDNYGATNISPPVNIVLGNPVLTTGGPVSFSPSLFAWGQKLSVTNPTISTVESVTVTFTSLQPPGTTVLGATGTNALGQPYIVFNVTVPPVTGIANYGSLLYLAPSMPTVTFTTSASLSPGLGFNIYSTNFVQITRKQFQGDGSFLLNFLSSTNYYYYVQYSSDLVTWFTSPLAIHGSGTQLQWVDLGPNITVLAPRTAPYRFYRVVSH